MRKIFQIIISIGFTGIVTWQLVPPNFFNFGQDVKKEALMLVKSLATKEYIRATYDQENESYAHGDTIMILQVATCNGEIMPENWSTCPHAPTRTDSFATARTENNTLVVFEYRVVVVEYK